MPSFMKDDMKKKDKERLEEMQEEIDAVLEPEIEDEVQREAHPEEPEVSNDNLAELGELRESLKEKDDRLMRLSADFENFRRRTAKEKEELAEVVKAGIIKDMLPLLDNFARGLTAGASDYDALKKGLEMIFSDFLEVLQKNGLEPIAAEGEMFDPKYHQAVMRVQNPDMLDDTIAAEMQKGYMVHGRVIRPSMVQVVAN